MDVDRIANPGSRLPTPESRLTSLIAERGPITVAAFVEFALYDPEHGYYARAAQRSGRAGDFFTSVDVGPLFGELLAVQIAEMARLLADRKTTAEPMPFSLVEAGAGNGRLSADILRALEARDPAVYRNAGLHLVEASGTARAAQRDTLAGHADRLAASTAALPDRFEGVLLANELLDAMPVHQVVMRDDGLRELYVAGGAGGLQLIEGPPSTPRLAAYLEAAGVALEPGWFADISLAAVDWVRDAARRLGRGFMILIDYGHEARHLYSAAHASGTLTSFSHHRAGGDRRAPHQPPWLIDPGERDITAHVDFTSIRAAAEAGGATTIALLDQTYFLMGLLGAAADPEAALRSPQFKTLIMPGGLGSVQKVLLLGKDVGRPALAGCSFSVRMT